MKELDKLVENYFTEKKAPELGMDMLLEMVEQSLEEMANLTATQLNKRIPAIQALMDAIDNETPLEVNPPEKQKFGVEEVIIDKNDPITITTYNKLKAASQPPHPPLKGILALKLRYPIRYPDPKNPENELEKTEITTGFLYKSPGAFGGKSSDYALQREIAAANQLQDAIEKALEIANDVGIEDIDIIVKGDSGKELRRFVDVKRVYRAEKQKFPEPKTDFTLQNKKGEDIAFISHKHGVRPQDFGQWSGLSAKAGEDITTHPEVIEFYRKLQQVLKKDKNDNYYYPPGISFSSKIKDEKLKMMAIFGPDYTNDFGPGGENNSDIVVQGTFVLTQDEVNQDEFILTADHLMVRGANQKPDEEIDPELESNPYDPTIKTRLAGDRSNQMVVGKDEEGNPKFVKVKGMRATIYPAAGRASVDLQDYINLKATSKEDYFAKKKKEKELKEETP